MSDHVHMCLKILPKYSMSYTIGKSAVRIHRWVLGNKKAATVVEKQNRQAEWLSYLDQLKKTHKRKIRLVEVMDRLENTVIIRKHPK